MQKNGKKIGSILIVLCLFVGLLSNVIGQEKFYADDAATKVTRGVVDTLGQLPQYNDETKKAATRGTADRPFVILEIVPYEEYAEFGYLISGCEPVDVENMYGRSALTTIASMGNATCSQKTAYFFPDEPEGNTANYDNAMTAYTSSDVECIGYYEYVGSGNGTIKRTIAEDGTATFQVSSGGEFIWHTVNDFEKAKYGDNPFADDRAKEVGTIGDRIYTKRVSEAGDRANITYNYYQYEHKDFFLTDTLGLSQEEADAYSIVVKTITPSELNSSKEWIDYADLVYLSPKSHVGNLPEIWKNYNRLGKTSTVSSYASYPFESNDFTWDTALRLYNKVTAEKDFAAIVMDDGVYNSVSSATQKTVAVDVYDWNLNKTGKTYSVSGSCNNVYKFVTMLMSMDSSLFKALYLSGDSPIISNGEISLQTGDAKTYWSVESFFLVKEYITDMNFYTEWTSGDFWKNYHSTANFTGEAYKYWVNDRVYTYKGDNSISQIYATTDLPSGKTGSKFTDFSHYINDTLGKTSATSSDAIRFILGLGVEKENPYPDSITVLDIEPCVDLDKNNNPKWVLKETYIRMLLPEFTGDINIVHQTSSEFNGKIEDINSKYQLIYLGLDKGAFNLDSSGNVQWNDDKDGLIYRHTGDILYSSEYVTTERTRTVKFLSTAAGATIDSTELRFPGNDITAKKVSDLSSFASAGYPIVADNALYNQDATKIDSKSNIYKFIGSSKTSGVYSTSQTDAILEALKNTVPCVTFTTMPPEYDGAESGGVITNPNYLPMSGGKSYMTFGFDITQPGYSYRIYVDADRNSKFDAEEAVITKTAVVGSNTYTYRVASSMVGLIQWKIEVYKTDNEDVRYERTGYSAAKNNSGTKKNIKVLQIMPTDGEHSGKLNLSTSTLFKTYYQNLEDYSIDITTITVDTYEGYFKDKGFKFDFSKGLDETNPVNESELGGNLSNYNMIIIGFGDAYGSKNISNAHGAVDYLKYFEAQGKSLLLTHDLTSMYNVKKDGKTPFGYSANMYLRDLMGMNPYGAISNQLTADERGQMIAYQNANKDDYDWIDSDAKHGFTYYALKRIGWPAAGNSSYKVLYQYMVVNPAGEAICSASTFAKNTGFNNNNDITTVASKLNEGQVTCYPYKIDDSLTIAPTHGQWYQLNMEDDDVTVWYTLANDNKATAWNATDSHGQGTALTYAVSPNDGANNYYIYSKGNVFYSGVGHSTVDGAMEAKLFVNTMIAAYRSAYEPPAIEITNEEVFTEVENNYTIELPQEFNNGSGGGEENDLEAETFTATDTYTVKFVPYEFNVVSTVLECTIQYEDGEYIDKIYGPDGSVIVANPTTHRFSNLQNGQEYTLEYPKMYLSDWKDASGITRPKRRLIVFNIKNNKTAVWNTTKLNMTVQPMFQLD